MRHNVRRIKTASIASRKISLKISDKNNTLRSYTFEIGMNNSFLEREI
jgi:hypothetical protein